MLKSVTPSLREKTKVFHQDILKGKFLKYHRPIRPELGQTLLTFVSALVLVTGFMKGDRVTLRTPESIEKRCEKYSYSSCGYRHYSKVTVGAVGLVSGKAPISLFRSGRL